MGAMANPPAMEIDLDAVYSVAISTPKGEIVMELDPQLAPTTVNHFVVNARNGFYDGLTFHRVVPEFVIQGGDPEGTGRGGPGYRFADEFKGNPHRHQVGSLSMANAGPNTNGSQFFITHSPQRHLNGRHTVFGKVIQGLDVVDAIAQGDKMERVTVGE